MCSPASPAPTTTITALGCQPVFTDRATLRTKAYAARAPLAARVSIYRWRRDRVDLPGLALEALADTRGTVLEAGCGLGTFVDRLRAGRPDLRVVPLDLSAGIHHVRAITEAELPAGVTWEAFLARVRARVTAVVERDGAWRMTNQVAPFTCR